MPCKRLLNTNGESRENNYSNVADVLFVWGIDSEDTVLFRGKLTGNTIFSGNN
jgi:hypothetical protein